MAGKIATPEDQRIGGRINALRLARGITQRQAGGHIDVTAAQLQKYEKGTNAISAGRAQMLAELFEVPVQALFDPPGKTVEVPTNADHALVNLTIAARAYAAEIDKLADKPAANPKGRAPAQGRRQQEQPLQATEDERIEQQRHMVREHVKERINAAR